MRQAGIIAAGALHALEHHRRRLAEDHENAKRLAEALRETPGIDLNPDHVQTNIIFFTVTSMTAQDLVDRLEARGVRMLALGPDRVRAVTHMDVSSEDVDRTIKILGKAL